MIFIGERGVWGFRRLSGLARGAVGIGEVLLENLGVPNRIEVGVSLSLLGGQPFLVQY
jgi:hypothetical protein